MPITLTCAGTPMRVAPKGHSGSVMVLPALKAGDHEIVDRSECEHARGQDVVKDQPERHRPNVVHPSVDAFIDALAGYCEAVAG